MASLGCGGELVRGSYRFAAQGRLLGSKHVPPPLCLIALIDADEVAVWEAGAGTRRQQASLQLSPDPGDPPGVTIEALQPAVLPGAGGGGGEGSCLPVTQACSC